MANSKAELPIGVFDSGIGGLTVAREIFRNLPNEKIIYFGDTARLPYGNKSQDTIIRYSRQIADFLVSQNVKAIVVACNTASAYALEAIKDDYEIPIIGVVEPGAHAAALATRNMKIGVIGTTATASSHIYDRYIKKLDPDAVICSKACPLFVSLVEEGMIDDPVTVQMIHRYLDDMILSNDIDTLILGCTHYPLLRTVIAREIGANCGAGPVNNGKIVLINPAYETSMALKKLLKENDMEHPAGTAMSLSDHHFYVSDAAEKFKDFAEKILEMKIDDIKVKVLS